MRVIKMGVFQENIIPRAINVFFSVNPRYRKKK